MTTRDITMLLFDQAKALTMGYIVPAKRFICPSFTTTPLRLRRPEVTA
jgi:hypothetical protein